MARILVAGADANIAQRRLLNDLLAQLRRAGHDAALWHTAQEGPARSVRETDAVVAILDGIPADAAAAVALADTLDKPCLGLASKGQTAPLFREITHLVEAEQEDAWWAALPGFYERIRPFAGRVVRDRIPELVREAGHDVQFRSLSAEERPRFLKQKIANEARELLAADLAKEKEEVADVLEALEAFILARGFERDDLRRVKEHKKKQRGGFERAFVVEATSGPQEPTRREAAREPASATAPPAALRPADDGSGPFAGVTGRAAPTAAQPAGVATGDDVDFEYSDVRRADAMDDVAGGRDVKGKFFEI